MGFDANRSLSTKKSPRANRFTAEFYQISTEKLTPMLLKLRMNTSKLIL
jgi:hypothetical protein